MSETLNTSTPVPDFLTIQVLFFASGEKPEVRRIETSLEAMQELVDGLITTFETGIQGTIGVANDEALPLELEFNRLIPNTGAAIFGPFFIAGDSPDFHSLSPLQLEQSLDSIAPNLNPTELVELMSALDGGKDWMEEWNL